MPDFCVRSIRSSSFLLLLPSDSLSVQDRPETCTDDEASREPQSTKGRLTYESTILSLEVTLAIVVTDDRETSFLIEFICRLRFHVPASESTRF